MGRGGALLQGIHEALRTAGARVAVASVDGFGAGPGPLWDRARVNHLLAEAAKSVGPLDVLVVVLGGAPLGATGPAAFPGRGSLQDRLGTLATAAAEEFREHGRTGRIVLVLPAVRGEMPPLTETRAALHSVLHLTQRLAVALGPHDITVNAISYGPLEEPAGAVKGPPVPFDRLRIPKGRLARVEDVTSAVVFLCSDEADYLTGGVLHLDGGHRLT